MKNSLQLYCISLVIASIASGCSESSSEGSGTVRVLVQAEETITQGLEPGPELENVVDGWTVSFDKYIVAIGDPRLGIASDAIEQTSEQRLVIDLTEVPPTGIPLAEFEGLEAKRYNFFGYQIVPTEGAQRHSSVAEQDFEAMVSAGASYYLVGQLSKTAGESCPPGDTCRATSEVGFRLLVPNLTHYGPCELDGIPGISAPANGTATAFVTLHGDHLFFSAFPVSAEVIERRAQWLADADLDANDEVDAAELQAISGDALSALFPSAHYDLGGWTAFPIENAFDFVRAQLHTQGHFQGEGECVWSVDG